MEVYESSKNNGTTIVATHVVYTIKNTKQRGNKRDKSVDYFGILLLP